MQIPELYRGFIITPVRTGGYDVINKLTGKWVWRPTERSARWWAGTWSRINDIVMNSRPKPLPRKVKVIKVRKLKGLPDDLPVMASAPRQPSRPKQRQHAR